MSFAPPKKLAACFEVLYRATIRLRLLGYSGEVDGLSPAAASEIAALADAVHNLPRLAQNWESCDEELLRAMLDDCDQRFPYAPRLLEVYDLASIDLDEKSL